MRLISLLRRAKGVALVGPSGAGKSTIFHLLLRFYDPQQGVVRVGGTDIRDLGLSDLRGHIGLVPQEPALFSATVRENLAFGRPEASDAEIRRPPDKPKHMISSWRWLMDMTRR